MQAQLPRVDHLKVPLMINRDEYHNKVITRLDMTFHTFRAHDEVKMFSNEMLRVMDCLPVQARVNYEQIAATEYLSHHGH